MRSAWCALTLTKMAEGGIYDHVGGGFCRYSVDAHWTIPHFEKMLYDNGPLLRLYSDLWRVDRQPLYARIVSDTADWVMREMQSPDARAATTRRSTPTPNTLKASFTCGRRTRSKPH